MVKYSLPTNPNFTITVSPENETYVMTFRAIRGLMYVTIFDNNGMRISGPVRICEGEWIIPHKAYNFEEAGNFVILEEHRQYPYFQDFNTTCEMRYYTLEEINKGVSLDE